MFYAFLQTIFSSVCQKIAFSVLCQFFAEHLLLALFIVFL